MAISRTVEAGASDGVKDSGAGSGADAASGRAPEGMAGLAKGLAVIEAFGQSSSQLTVAEAARLTDVTRAAARRCLLTLTDLGYLTHDGKHFRPTPRMLRLGCAYLDTSSLPALAQPHLVAARDALTESVSLAVWEDGWAVFVARAEAPRIVSTGVRIGARLPAHCSATGRVLLGAMPDDAVAEFLARGGRERRTLHTVVAPGELERVIEAARSDGYASSDEELELGMRAVAVPVRDVRGRTVAAMSVSASSARVTAEEMHRDFVPVLAAEAARLGRML
jgi:IclR family pca regulon transcriptional regulator